MLAEMDIITEPYIYAQSVDEIDDWLALFYKSPARSRVAYDIETNNTLDPRVGKLVLLQLKVVGLPCLIIDARSIQLNHISHLLSPIFTSDKYLKIAHNAKFEYAWTLQHLGIRIVRMYDTMLAEKLLNAGLNVEASLKGVALRRLGLTLDKSLQTSFDTYPLSPGQLNYACADVDILFPIMAQQTAELRSEGMLSVAQLEFDLIPAIAEAGLHGVMINEERWRAHVVMLTRECEALEVGLVHELTPFVEKYRAAKYGESMIAYRSKLADYEARHSLREAQAAQVKERALESMGKGDAQRALNAWKRENPSIPKPPAPVCGEGPINLSSYDQLQGALDAADVDLPQKDSGGLETGHKALTMAAAEYPICERILEWREYSKLVTAFGENVLAMLDENGRLHPDFNQLVSTGRLSCSKPNVQQIPGADKELGKEFRRSFVAPHGRVLVAADYSQIELRVLAEVSGEPNLIKSFADGVDLHSLTASVMFSLPLENLKDLHPHERKVAKMINFGVAYGLTPTGLSANLNIPLPDAKHFVASYFAANPYIRAWLDETARVGVGNLYSTTMLGRKRFFYPLPVVEREGRPNNVQWSTWKPKVNAEAMREYRRMKAGYERMICNAVIQGTSADITKRAMVSIYRKIHEWGIDAAIVMSVHDEIVVECNDQESALVADMVVEEMKKAGEEFLKVVPVEVSFAVGEHWAH